MNESPSVLSRLFGWAWRVVSGLYKLIVILGSVLIVAAFWLAYHGGPTVKVQQNVALILAPSGSLVEQLDYEPGRAFLDSIAGNQPSQTLLRDQIEALDKAAKDPRITFVVLKLDELDDAGLAQLQELGHAVQKFQKSGKKVIAYGPWYEQNQYLLAAQADEIALDPLGVVNLEGLSSYNNYFKEGLDKLGVQVNVFRVGEYKSAVEPFLRNDMSEDAKTANREWLSDLWRDYSKRVAQSRHLPETAVDDYVRNFATGLVKNNGDSALYAKSAGLVTSLETLTQFRKRMGAIVGFDDDHGSFRQINAADYLSAIRHEVGKKKNEHDGKVALIVVQGEIVDGKGEIGQAGGETVSDLLDQARRDRDVDAVVLRVDSPGGSVWASEQIRRQVENLRAEGKPVVASMSSVAASGGYWVSMNADQIWAQPSTITGSIGIFGLVPTINKPLEKLGIHTDGIGTTSLAGAFRMDRPLSPEVGSIIQSQINKGYHDFITGVAKARKLPLDRVNQIARGRVWSGQTAKSIGLVDQFGDLQNAADAAAKLAGLEAGSYDLEEFMPEHDFTSELFSRFSGSIGLNALPGVPAWARRVLEQTDIVRSLNWLNDPHAEYAYCFCKASMGGRKGY
jgi:protease-4